MTSESNLVEQGRVAIDAVAERVKTDQTYAARFKDAPAEVLLEAGAPAEGIGDILRETGFSDDDVGGYLMSLNINPLPGISTPRPSVGPGQPGLPGGLGGRGGVMDCSQTCYCSSSCLLTL